MEASAPFARALPRPAPEHPATQLLLFGIRQLGSAGLNDAAAANAFVTAFGKNFRRPLVLLRTLMAELSESAQRPVQIAPWCCRRMTADEAILTDALIAASDRPERTLILLADLLGIQPSAVPIATAQLLSCAFAEAGLALG